MIRAEEKRQAFTLLEVLLTMMLCVIIAGMAWLTIQGPFSRQRLRAAADSVRNIWVEARVDAMKTGCTFAFRYRVRGDHYRLAAQEDGASSNSSQDGSWSVNTSASNEDSGDEPLPPPVEKSLPPGIQFLSPDGAAGDLAAMGDHSSSKPAADSGEWSDPIYFYADGSTSDARVVLAADKHTAMQLMLRGMTGTVTANDDVNATTK